MLPVKFISQTSIFLPLSYRMSFNFDRLKIWNNFRNVNCCRKLSGLKEEPMAHRSSRCFVNSLPDYSGDTIKVDSEEWRKIILSMADECAQRQPCNSRNIDGGLYVGTAGIAYMFYHISQSPKFTEEKAKLLQKALEIIKATEKVDAKVTKREPSDVCSFILGQAGMNAVSAAIHQAVGDTSGAEERLKKYVAASEYCKDIRCFSFGSDELFVGRAGYVCGALWLKKIFKKDILPESELIELCNTIVKSGQKSRRDATFTSPLIYTYYNTNYFGAAHGISSILQVLLSCPAFMNKVDSNSLNDINTTIDVLLSLQGQNGNFPCSADDLSSRSAHESELVHWCHGAPGVVYLMAKAYLKTRNRKYMDSCIKCGEITWEKGLLRKGPGICHGVAGSGYVFLLLYRLTDDIKYLHRANEFAKFLKTNEFRDGARTPDRPHSLYEGKAGTACFLTDLLHPESASFPFMDVF